MAAKRSGRGGRAGAAAAAAGRIQGDLCGELGQGLAKPGARLAREAENKVNKTSMQIDERSC
eukprot:762961-Hanusia_phi.AAC.2